MLVTRKVIIDSTSVQAMLPVRLAPPGKTTIRPMRLAMKMNQNTVSR